MISEPGAETGGSRAARVDERLLEIAETQGNHGARLTALERDKQDINSQLKDIRDVVHRIESASRSNAPGNANDLLMNRVLDVLAKPPPQPAAAPADYASAMVEAMRAKRATDPVAVIGYLMGGGTIGGFLIWGLLTVRALMGV